MIEERCVDMKQPKKCDLCGQGAETSPVVRESLHSRSKIEQLCKNCGTRSKPVETKEEANKLVFNCFISMGW